MRTGALRRWLAVLALCVAGSASAQVATTSLTLVSDPGEFFGDGETFTYATSDGSFSLYTYPIGAELTFSSATNSWGVYFAPPRGEEFGPGVYENAVRWGTGSPVQPGLSLWGNGKNSGEETGRYVVLQCDRDAAGNIVRFAADFEMHTFGSPAALQGSIRYASALSLAPRLSVAPAWTYEGGEADPGSLGFRVSLSRRSITPVTFHYSTVDDTARAGVDYGAVSGTATIAAGQTTARVDVPVIGNDVQESDRSLVLALDDVEGAETGFGRGLGQIVDDDPIRTYLRLDGDSGSVLGEATLLLTARDGVISAETFPDGVRFDFDGGIDHMWSLELRAPAGRAPLRPGVYEVPSSSPTPLPVLQLSGPGAGGCWGPVVGRFSVLQSEVAADGALLRFAADFEYGCAGSGGAVVGSMRYDSAAPRGALVSVSSAAGYEGDGEPRSLPFFISLSDRTAVPVSVHYATADGSATSGVDYDAVSGTAEFGVGQRVVRVDVPIHGDHAAQGDRIFGFDLSDPVGAPVGFGHGVGTIADDDALTNVVYLDSEPGDYVGSGQSLRMAAPIDGSLTTVRSGRALSLYFSGLHWFGFDFATPGDGPPAPGIYERFTWFGDPNGASMDVYGDGHGCDTRTGRLVIREAQYAEDGTPLVFAADFEQHCEGGTPALFGSIRLNSAIPGTRYLGIPKFHQSFGAPYVDTGSTTSLTFAIENPNPDQALSGIALVDDLPAGLVVKAESVVDSTCGGTLSIAPGGASLSVVGASLGPATSCRVILDVTGAAAGVKKSVATLHTDQAVVSAVAKATLNVGIPLPFVRLDGDAGDWISGGGVFLLAAPDAAYVGRGSESQAGCSFWKASTGFGFGFAPPIGGSLLPGDFEGARRLVSPNDAPGLEINGPGQACNSVAGRFVVLEAAYSPDDEIDVLAIDAEQHCEDAVPALYASLRINSTIPASTRPHPGAPAPGVTAPLVTLLASGHLGLVADVTPNGESTAAWFELGRTSDYGVNTPLRWMGNGLDGSPLSSEVPALGCGLFHVRTVAQRTFDGLMAYSGDQIFSLGPCAKGDVNGDRLVNSSDMLYLIGFLFADGPPPRDPGSGDVNADGVTDVRDVFWLTSFLFAGGPPIK